MKDMCVFAPVFMCICLYMTHIPSKPGSVTFCVAPSNCFTPEINAAPLTNEQSGTAVCEDVYKAPLLVTNTTITKVSSG